MRDQKVVNGEVVSEVAEVVEEEAVATGAGTGKTRDDVKIISHKFRTSFHWFIART